MDFHDLFSDAASRPVQAAEQVLNGISDQTLHAMPGGANSIAWLIWHAARQQDVQVAELSGTPQVWEQGGWADKLGVRRGADESGFGDSASDVAALHITAPGQLLAYLAATADAVSAYARGLSAGDLDDVVDTSWTPHVTRGVRLYSTIDDAAVHVGQAAYARGLIESWSVGV